MVVELVNTPCAFLTYLILALDFVPFHGADCLLNVAVCVLLCLGGDPRTAGSLIELYWLSLCF
jgi:hypothetical protein